MCISNIFIHFFLEADLSVIGKYICRAENKFGTEDQVVTLTVTGISKKSKHFLLPLVNVCNTKLNQNKELVCIKVQK